jgi:hypothetical protein
MAFGWAYSIMYESTPPITAYLSKASTVTHESAIREKQISN